MKTINLAKMSASILALTCMGSASNHNETLSSAEGNPSYQSVLAEFDSIDARLAELNKIMRDKEKKSRERFQITNGEAKARERILNEEFQFFSLIHKDYFVGILNIKRAQILNKNINNMPNEEAKARERILNEEFQFFSLMKHEEACQIQRWQRYEKMCRGRSSSDATPPANFLYLFAVNWKKLNEDADRERQQIVDKERIQQQEINRRMHEEYSYAKREEQERIERARRQVQLRQEQERIERARRQEQVRQEQERIEETRRQEQIRKTRLRQAQTNLKKRCNYN
ncbi:MAG: hypothetical protein CNLJKLNK_00055 [Holosporales bacterium]